MARQPLLLDTDPGIDDALAILYLMARGAWDLAAITVTAGNVGLERALKNTMGLAALLGIEADVPVHAGCRKPLVRPLVMAENIHGEDGLGGASLPEPKAKSQPEHAANIINSLSRIHEGELTIIALGPLTNVAAALILDPSLPERIKHLIFMGGAVNVPGNVQPGAAEFNIYADPEAARLVAESGMRFTMVGLDATAKALVDREQANTLGGETAPLRLARDLLSYYIEACRRESNIAACALHDPLAVAVAEDPGWVNLRRGNLYVETRGEFSRGKTSFVPLGQKEADDIQNPLPASSTGEISVDIGREGFPAHFLGTLAPYAW